MNILNNTFTLILLGVLFAACGSQESNNQEISSDTLGEAEGIEFGIDDNLQEDADFLIVSYMNSQLQVAFGGNCRTKCIVTRGKNS